VTPTEFPESHIDLLQEPHAAVLTTISADGRPHSTAIWFVLDDGVLKTSGVVSLQKYRNLAARPACSLFVMDPGPRRRWIEVRADAELLPDPDLAMLPKISSKYAVDATKIMPGAERALVVFHPHKVVTFESARRGPS
jgi:PPOX class probable F420-dependent enzyme